MTSGVTLHIRDQLSSMIIKNGKEELLQYLHRHLWAEAIMLPIDHSINAAWIFYIQNKNFTDSNGLCLNSIEQPADVTDNVFDMEKPGHQHLRRHHPCRHLKKLNSVLFANVLVDDQDIFAAEHIRISQSPSFKWATA